MWIKFIRDIGTAKSGSFADVADAIAQNYVALGVAEAAPEDPAQRAAAMAVAQLQPLIQAQADRTRSQLGASQGPLARPRQLVASNGGIEFNGRIDSGSQEIDRRRAGPGHFVRTVIEALGSRDADECRNAHEELCRPWEEGGYGSSRNMAEGAGSTGGYATPVVYESMFFEVAAEEEIIVPAADVKPLAARQVEYTALNQFTAPVLGQSAWYGGVQVYRKGEKVQRTETDFALKKIQMLAQDLTALTELSRDLIYDASGMDAYAIRMIGGAIGWREDWESFQGNGAGQFLGVTNSPAMLLVDRNTNDEILYQDVFTMKTRFAQNPMSPCWVCHPYTLYQLETMQDPSGRFIFIPYSTIVATPGVGAVAAGGLAYRPSGVFLGWQLYASEKAPVLGDACDLMLIDRKKYWVGRRSGLEIGLSEHFLFDTDQIAIRAKIRNDGKPGQIAPYYLADGTQSNQVSGFVGTSATHS
jgi:HK97 family phage major capsid protein